MAVPKDKVIAILKEKLKGKSHTKTFIDKTAARYAEKIENEEAIAEYIDDRIDDLLEAGQEADRRSTAAVDKAKKDLQDKIDGKEKPPAEEKPVISDDTPEWAKALIKNVEALGTTVDNIQKKDTSKSISEQFFASDKLKGIDPKLLKGRIPTKLEDLEAAIDEAATELKDYVKTDDQQASTTVRKFGNEKPLAGGNHKPGQQTSTAKEATKEELDAVMGKIKV